MSRMGKIQNDYAAMTIKKERLLFEVLYMFVYIKSPLNEHRRV